MDNLIPAGSFSNRSFYSAHFMDLAMWEPFVRQVCERHAFACLFVRPGLPGSFPTFVVELSPGQNTQTAVVKFFGPLFDGETSFHIERRLGHFNRQQNLPIPTPAILAEGQIAPQWCYLVFEGVPGVSIGEARQQLSQAAWSEVARLVGKYIRGLHTVTQDFLAADPRVPSAMSWDEYVVYLEAQRLNAATHHQQWEDLPAHLTNQVQDFILPVDQLIDLSSPPHLIHADLTADHLLGRVVPIGEGGHPDRVPGLSVGAGWETLAIIDWGDARLGNILYELAAVHMDLFHSDKRLLKVCLQEYGLPDFYQRGFAHKALSMVLLHQFPMPASFYSPYAEVSTLDELAERLFGV